MSVEVDWRCEAYSCRHSCGSESCSEVKSGRSLSVRCVARVKLYEAQIAFPCRSSWARRDEARDSARGRATAGAVSARLARLDRPRDRDDRRCARDAAAKGACCSSSNRSMCSRISPWRSSCSRNRCWPPGCRHAVRREPIRCARCGRLVFRQIQASSVVRKIGQVTGTLALRNIRIREIP